MVNVRRCDGGWWLKVIAVDCSFSDDVDDLGIFLYEGVDPKKSCFDLAIPVINHLARFNSVETIISELQSIGYLNDSDTNFESVLQFLTLLSFAGKNEFLIDAYDYMVLFQIPLLQIHFWLLYLKLHKMWYE